MKIRVRLFGPAAEKAGCSEIEVESEATLRAAVDAVLEKKPELKSLSGGMKYARNAEYAGLDTALEPGDEIAFLPPVGGG